jgi:hypothetical protein
VVPDTQEAEAGGLLGRETSLARPCLKNKTNQKQVLQDYVEYGTFYLNKTTN